MRKVGAGVLVAVLVAGVGGAGSAHAAPLFNPTGPWNAPIPASPALEPNSALQVSTLSTSIVLGSPKPDIATTSSTTPIYRVTSSTPKVPVVINGPASGPGPTHQLLQSMIDAHGGLPIPAGATVSPGSDGRLTVLDTTNKHLFEFYRASPPEQNADGKWHADTAGLMDQYDLDPGYFSSSAWPGLTPSQGWDWGARATQLPLAGGLITFEDLNAGVIDHAVEVEIKDACPDQFVYPAQDTDGQDSSPACIHEGARLQLDPAHNVDADNDPPLAKMVERAAKKYGLIVTDRTQSYPARFYGQNKLTEPTNPYTSGPGVGGVPNGNLGYFGGKTATQVFANFPWDKLRVIAGHHCTATPCVP